MSFNDFVKLLYGYNNIFYLVAIFALSIWCAYNIIDLIFSIIGLSSIGEFVYDILNIDDEFIENIIGYVGMFALLILYIALCNSCYMTEYYNKQKPVTTPPKPVVKTKPVIKQKHPQKHPQKHVSKKPVRGGRRR